MIHRPCRPPTLIDLMILIAGTAVGFAGVRAESGPHYHDSIAYFLKDPGKSFYLLLNPSPNCPAWFKSIQEMAPFIGQTTPVLAAWTFAFLLIRLRGPRLPLARGFRQPGMVMGASVAMALVITTLLGLVQLALGRMGITSMTDPRFTMTLSFLACRSLQVEIIGMIVVVSWGMLAVSRRWRREHGWIDWLGIAIGVGWIIDLANQFLLVSLI